jgi:hypothetical protein
MGLHAHISFVGCTIGPFVAAVLRHMFHLIDKIKIKMQTVIVLLVLYKIIDAFCKNDNAHLGCIKAATLLDLLKNDSDLWSIFAIDSSRNQ